MEEENIMTIEITIERRGEFFRAFSSTGGAILIETKARPSARQVLRQAAADIADRMEGIPPQFPNFTA